MPAATLELTNKCPGLFLGERLPTRGVGRPGMVLDFAERTCNRCDE
jgi:hypothetical protein